ncbi:MAG: AEC family transporter [Rhodospirillales bacterium]|nr:AEC family transporter [Rhodospirillales bacterium]
MEAVINVVLPVFAIVGTGYLTGRFKVLGNEASPALSGFVFYISLPVLLFIAMTRVSPDIIFDLAFIGTYAASLIIGLGLTMGILRILYPGRRLAESALGGMSAIYGNTGYMGIPLVMIAFGPEAAVPAVIATVVNAALIFGVVCSLVEADLSIGGGPAGIAKDVLVGLAKNPLFVAPVLGIIVSVSEIPVPASLTAFCDILGAAAGPCALFSLGLFLVGKKLNKDAGEVALIAVIKLFILPAICWIMITWVFDLSPMWGPLRSS